MSLWLRALCSKCAVWHVQESGAAPSSVGTLCEPWAHFTDALPASQWDMPPNTTRLPGSAAQSPTSTHSQTQSMLRLSASQASTPRAAHRSSSQPSPPALGNRQAVHGSCGSTGTGSGLSHALAPVRALPPRPSVLCPRGASGHSLPWPGPAATHLARKQSQAAPSAFDRRQVPDSRTAAWAWTDAQSGKGGMRGRSTAAELQQQRRVQCSAAAVAAESCGQQCSRFAWPCHQVRMQATPVDHAL